MNTLALAPPACANVGTMPSLAFKTSTLDEATRAKAEAQHAPVCQVADSYRKVLCRRRASAGVCCGCCGGGGYGRKRGARGGGRKEGEEQNDEVSRRHFREAGGC